MTTKPTTVPSVEVQQAAAAIVPPTKQTSVPVTPPVTLARPTPPSPVLPSVPPARTVHAKPADYADTIRIDWSVVPLDLGRLLYATLRAEFDRAGSILNSRSMPIPGCYRCFMCKKEHIGDPRGKDYSYINPETGLIEVVEICGELCWINYQNLRIAQRAEAYRRREIAESAATENDDAA